MSDEPPRRVLSDDEKKALADARWHWDAAYRITFDEVAGIFQARYMDGPAGADVIEADIWRLRDLLRNDYGLRGGRGAGD